MTSSDQEAQTLRAAPDVPCPSCGAILDLAGEQCGKCKLTLRRLDLKFGTIPRHANYVTDRTERLPLIEVERAREKLRLFERQFPQSPLSVFVVDLAKDQSACEYVFWLSNRGRFGFAEAIGAKNFDLLLLLDTGNGQVALAAGYGLEGLVTASQLAVVVDAVAEQLRDETFAGAIDSCIGQLTEILRAASEKSTQAIAAFQSDV